MVKMKNLNFFSLFGSRGPSTYTSVFVAVCVARETRTCCVRCCSVEKHAKRESEGARASSSQRLGSM